MFLVLESLQKSLRVFTQILLINILCDRLSVDRFIYSCVWRGYCGQIQINHCKERKQAIALAVWPRGSIMRARNDHTSHDKICSAIFVEPLLSVGDTDYNLILMYYLPSSSYFGNTNNSRYRTAMIVRIDFKQSANLKDWSFINSEWWIALVLLK